MHFPWAISFYEMGSQETEKNKELSKRREIYSREVTELRGEKKEKIDEMLIKPVVE